MVLENMAGRRADLGKPLPFFKAAFADSEGRVWLPSHEPAGPRQGNSPYIALSPEGEWLGKVEGPDGLRILDVAAGRVLGIELDEMDVQRVVVYDLVESG